MRRIAIMLTCFKFIAVPSVVITIATSFFLLSSGTPFFLIPVFWTKIITTGLLLLFVHFFRDSQFYFFNNIGCSTYTIYANMIAVDFIMATISFSLALFF